MLIGKIIPTKNEYLTLIFYIKKSFFNAMKRIIKTHKTGTYFANQRDKDGIMGSCFYHPHYLIIFPLSKRNASPRRITKNNGKMKINKGDR